VAASDLSESIILLPLLRELRASAPNTRLAVLDKAPALLAKQAEQGEIDLAFHISDEGPPGLRRRPLFRERYVLAGRAGHPALQSAPSLAQFCELEHVIVSPDGGGFVANTDTALAAVGLQRRVVLSVPHFLFVQSALADSELVAMLPSRLVRNQPALSVVEAPLDVPGYEMSMYWPERVHRDPAHWWLREFIAERV
jgi:DNA-binding transcriptional LysR family regulator